MPMAYSSGVAWRTAISRTKPSASASHNAWRNSAPISACLPAPASCATDGGNAIITPIAATMTSDHTLVPTATADSVFAP